MKGRIVAAAAVLLLLLCAVPAWAVLPEEVEDALSPDAQALLEQLDEDTADSGTLSKGVAKLWDNACRLLAAEFRSSLRVMVVLLGAVLLYGVAEGSFQAAEHPLMANFVPLSFVLVITLTAAGDVQTMMGAGTETMEQLDVLSTALLPSLAAAVAASGGIVSAGVRQVATVFFANLLMTLIHSVLLPLVYFYVAAAAADAMLPGRHLAGISTAIRKGTVWLLTGALALFTLYLTVSGAAAGFADTVTARLARGAVGVLPVVGSILADAADAVLAGAGAVRNTVGVAGLLAVLAVCLLPLVRLGAQYLVYKAAALLAGVLGAERLTGLIDALGGAFGLIFGMTGACGLLLLISISSALGVVTG